MKIEDKSKKNEVKREKRRKATAEDFTPVSLINQMLDKWVEFNPTYFTDPTKTCCDPACGNGNMLVEVLKRKLANKHKPLQALSTIYGVDIMPDNVKETRLRLLKIVHDQGHEITKEMMVELFCNIVVCKPPRYPNGALDYDFSFHRKKGVNNTQIDEWMKGIKSGWLDKFQNEDVGAKDDEDIEDAGQRELADYFD